MYICINYIPEIWNYGDIMVLVWTPQPHPPPHAKACVPRNCDINARIKIIFDTAIDDLEWKNPIDFGDHRENQNRMKKLVHSITWSKMYWSTSYLRENKSSVLIWNGEKCDRKGFSVIQNGRRRPFCGKTFRKMKVAYWSEMARNAIESDFRSSKMAAGGHFVTKLPKK